jgi:hypothetical protein
MNPVNGHFLIKPEEHDWKVADPMKIPFADVLERWTQLSSVQSFSAFSAISPPAREASEGTLFEKSF